MSGDETACGCEEVAKGASESTGCGGSEGLEERMEKQPSESADSSLRNPAPVGWGLQPKGPRP